MFVKPLVLYMRANFMSLMHTQKIQVTHWIFQGTVYIPLESVSQQALVEY